MYKRDVSFSRQLHQSGGLVIFDCDGVIADTETTTMAVLCNMLEELGCNLPASTAVERYRGRKMANVLQEIEALFELSLPADFTTVFREACLSRYSQGLEPSPGLEEVLDSLQERYCIASSAPQEKIRHILQCVGLSERFEGRLFSAYDIQSWKPEPALFLHAASTFGVEPERCAVIEDSRAGLAAGLAANMTTFAYLAYDDSPSVDGTDAIGFRSMYELTNLLANWRATSVAVSNHEAESFFPLAR